MELSVVILAKNEESNISRAIKSVKPIASEILVIDDFSTDKTKGAAAELGARVVTHGLNDNFAGQRNFGLEQASGDWVLFIDADEEMTPDLAKELEKKINSSSVDGYYLKRQDFFGGRLLKHGDHPRQSRHNGLISLLRLAKKDTGKWVYPVHEVWQIKGPTASLENPLNHYPHQTISEFIDSVNYFSTLRAKQLFQEGEKGSLTQIVLYPLGKFIQNYFFRLGFLDGTPGAVTALMMALHSFLSRSKLYLMARND